MRIAAALPIRLGVTAVDDGSTDDSAECLQSVASFDKLESIEIVRLCVNLGHQRAIAVGLCVMVEDGDCDSVLIMDADGEDSPKVIAKLLQAAGDQTDFCIVAQRRKCSESLRFKLSYLVYKRIFKLLTGNQIDFGNFYLMSKGYAHRLVRISDLWNNLPAAILRSKLPINAVPTDRSRRYAGKSKMNFTSLVVHGLSGISVYAETIFVRLLLLTLFLVCLTTVSIAAVLSLRIFFPALATPGWATTVSFGLIIILVEAMGWLIALVAGGFLVSKMFELYMSSLAHDQTWYLLVAERLLSGATLYGPQIRETNPPLIVWFSILPVLLIRLIPLSAALALRLLVLFMLLCSVAWCVRLVRVGAKFKSSISAILIGFAVLYVELDTGPSDFAQREQLFIILLLPYLLAVGTGAVSRLSLVERCGLGLAAGLAISFKPQEALVLIAFELVLIVHLRSLRRALSPELLATTFTALVYLALILRFTPTYLNQTVPLLTDTYWAYGTASAFDLALTFKKIAVLSLLALLTCFALRRSLPDPLTTVALIFGAFGAAIAFVIQHTFWPYHRYPCRALVGLALLYLLVDLLDPVLVRLTAEPKLASRLVLACGAFVAICLWPLRHRGMPREAPPSDQAELNKLFSQYKPPTSVYIFSTSLQYLPAVVDHHLTWGSGFPCLWILPSIVQNERGASTPLATFKQLSPSTIDWLSTLQRTESANDLKYWHPELILVEHCSKSHGCQAIEGEDFDILSWFLQSPAFASEWSHYRRFQGLTSFDRYIRIR